MYSPFFDSYGKPLTIEKIKYEHLSQLVDCDEGHHLEFKLLLKDDEKAQLAKEIASFANCEGILFQINEILLASLSVVCFAKSLS